MIQYDLRSVEIIKGVKPESKSVKPCSKYAFDKLEVGYAFIFPGEYSSKLARKYASAGHSYGRRTGKKFVFRKEINDAGLIEFWCYRVQ